LFDQVRRVGQVAEARTPEAKDRLAAGNVSSPSMSITALPIAAGAASGGSACSSPGAQPAANAEEAAETITELPMTLPFKIRIPS